MNVEGGEMSLYTTLEYSGPKIYLTCYDVTGGHNNRKEVGTASYNRLTCELRTLRVDRDHRNRGVGTTLLAETEALMEKDGCRVCHVLAYPEDQQSFRPLHAFYRRNGYVHMASRWWPSVLWNVLTNAPPGASGNWMQKSLRP